MANNDDPVRRKNYRAVERELWMLSGNECAHEGCTNRMVTESGAYVGEIAHIRGVRPTSARHDSSMSDDDLRDKSNLVLLCHEHHIETDDESRYPVKRMRRMKKNHELRFIKAYSQFQVQFNDYTDALHPTRCKTLNRWLDVLGLHGSDFDQDYIEAEARELNELADRLSSLTDEARHLLSFIVSRGSEDRIKNTFHFQLSELARRTRTSKSRIVDIFDELERLDFGNIYWSEDGEPPEAVVYARTGSHRSYSPLLNSLKDFCEQSDHDLDELIIHLRFDLFDR